MTAGIKGMILKPLGIGSLHFRIDDEARIRFQRIGNADDIAGIDQSSGACAAFVIIELTASENGDAAPGG